VATSFLVSFLKRRLSPLCVEYGRDGLRLSLFRGGKDRRRRRQEKKERGGLHRGLVSLFGLKIAFRLLRAQFTSDTNTINGQDPNQRGTRANNLNRSKKHSNLTIGIKL
jgi:hypothetical protein